jgi:hypothetical protein
MEIIKINHQNFWVMGNGIYAKVFFELSTGAKIGYWVIKKSLIIPIKA